MSRLGRVNGSASAPLTVTIGGPRSLISIQIELAALFADNLCGHQTKAR